MKPLLISLAFILTLSTLCFAQTDSIKTVTSNAKIKKLQERRINDLKITVFGTVNMTAGQIESLGTAPISRGAWDKFFIRLFYGTGIVTGLASVADNAYCSLRIAALKYKRHRLTKAAKSSK